MNAIFIRKIRKNTDREFLIEKRKNCREKEQIQIKK